MIGDYLFALTQRDLQVTPLGVVNQQVRKVGIAAALATATFDVPFDRAFWWTGLHMRAICPGGAVSTIDGISYIAPAFDEVSRFFRAAPAVADWNIATGTGALPGAAGRMQAPQLIMPGTRLYFEATYSLVINNTLEVTLMGILIPRGNLAFQTLASA